MNARFYGQRGARDLPQVLVLVVMAAAAVQSVLVPRALYADGPYDLWLVLHSRWFVIIGSARTFAIVVNQLPVVTALHLGVRDLDVLIAVYSFGVAAVPVLIWLLALLIQFRRAFFWPLVVMYAAAFLTSGFIAIGEYTFAFAFVALAVSILLVPGPIRVRLAVPLVLATTVLILCYEGMVFLGIPVVVLIIVRLVRPAWLGLPVTRARLELAVLWYSLVAMCLSVGVAALSVLVRSRNSADTNLAGALDVDLALEMNKQWQVAFAAAIVLILSPLIRQPVVRVVVDVVAGTIAARLFLSSLWAPAWLHYNTRSLAAYTFTVLLGLALLVLLWRSRVPRRAGRRASPPASGPWPLVSALAALVLFSAMSVSFWQLNRGYGLWLDDLRAVVVAGNGPIDIATTDLYTGAQSQYSWGWTNPYLSALLQTHDGQGSVLSHVDTLDTVIPISPPSTPEFFETYHR